MDKEVRPFVRRDEETNVITIYGYITNNDNPPAKPNGKPADPDPISRACHKAKKSLIREFGACVLYTIKRTLNYDGVHTITISFLFSNTGDHSVPHDESERFRTVSKNWETIMSMRCKDSIEDYILSSL